MIEATQQLTFGEHSWVPQRIGVSRAPLLTALITADNLSIWFPLAAAIVLTHPSPPAAWALPSWWTSPVEYSARALDVLTETGATVVDLERVGRPLLDDLRARARAAFSVPTKEDVENTQGFSGKGAQGSTSASKSRARGGKPRRGGSSSRRKN
jgi:hypothetical protein